MERNFSESNLKQTVLFQVQEKYYEPFKINEIRNETTSNGQCHLVARIFIGNKGCKSFEVIFKTSKLCAILFAGFFRDIESALDFFMEIDDSNSIQKN